MNTTHRHPFLSAYIITKNEEGNIARAIQSVAWMDEIVVLDSGSTDRTVAIAESLGAIVRNTDFKGFVEQKNTAMDLCSGDWLFNLDADEEMTPELRESMKAALSEEKNVPDVFRVVRKTCYMGRWITHAGWYPEYRVRLSRKGKARWAGEAIHEHLESSGRKETLSGDLLHRPYNDIGEHLQTIGRYTRIWAEREHANHRKPQLTDLVFRPPIRFIKMYFLRRGFLDGIQGFVISVMGMWYTFLKYARLYELSRSHEE